jgi:hypothetical protein
MKLYQAINSIRIGGIAVESLNREVSKAYLFPYTWFTPEHVDTIVTSSLLYDHLNYLDYTQNRSYVVPMLKGLDVLYKSGDITKSEYIGYEAHLSSLRQRGHLRGISVTDIQQMIVDRQRTLVEMIEKNYELTRSLNVPLEKSSEFVFISTPKVSRSILRAVGVSKSSKLPRTPLDTDTKQKMSHGTRKYEFYPAFSGSSYIPLTWPQAQAILLTYTEIACKQHNCSPLALEEIYASSLKNLYRSKLPDLEMKQTELESEQRLTDVLFTELIQIQCPSLYRVWELDPSSVVDMRNQTYDLRERARKSIAHIFMEHFEGLTPSELKMDLFITEDLVPKLKELKEEYQNLKKGKSFVTTVKAKLSGCIAVLSSLGLVQIALQSVLTPEQQVLVNAITIGAEVVGELGSEGWSIRSSSQRSDEIEANPLWDLICFLDMQNPSWSE